MKGKFYNMKQSFFLTLSKNQSKLQKVTVIASSLLLVSNILLSMKVLTASERIVLVPPTFSSDIWVEGKKASDSYVTEMALYMTHLLLDVSSSNMAFSHETFLKYVSPSQTNLIGARLKEEEDFYRKNGMSSMFHATQVTHDQQNNKVFVKGVLTQLESSKVVDTKPFECEVTYDLRDGVFKVLSFTKKGE